jgi:hypothetical protein
MKKSNPNDLKLFKIIFLFLMPLAALSQNVQIRGNIIDGKNGSAIQGAKITIDGGLGSATSDSQGKFILIASLTVKSGETILINIQKSGYKPFDLYYPASEPLLIHLTELDNGRQGNTHSIVKTNTRFNTLEIKNQEFIFSKYNWPFHTEEGGEDYNSSITPADVRRQIKSLNPFSSNLPTIPNKEMRLRFNVVKSGPKNLYLDKIYLQVEKTYPVDPKTMFLNAWLPKLETHQLQATLNKDKLIYDLNPNDDVYELLSDKPEFFSLKITGDNTCRNKIFEFRIVTSYVDAQGKRFDIPSDRYFHIAFMPRELENPLEQPNTPIPDKDTAPVIEKGNTVILPIDSTNGIHGGGKVVENPIEKYAAKKFLNAINADPTKILEYFDGQILMVGPSLWKLIRLDGTDTLSGIHTQIRSPAGELIDARAYMDSISVKNIFNTDLLRYLFSKHSLGEIRAASDIERTEFYSLINFEIYGKPVWIFDHGDSRLLAYFENGKLKWLERIDYYNEKDILEWVKHTTYPLTAPDSARIATIRKMPFNPQESRLYSARKPYELDYDQFLDYLYTAAEDNSFLHMDLFIRDNPTNSGIFLTQSLRYDHDHPIASGSFFWEMLCKISILKRDLELDNSSLTYLQNFDAYKNGAGKYPLRRMLFIHENKHGQPGKVNLDAIATPFGDRPYDSLGDSICSNLLLIASGKPDEAYRKYNLQIPKFFALRGGEYPMTYFRSGKLVLYTHEMEVSFFWYLLLLCAHQDTQTANVVTAFCISRGMSFSNLCYAELPRITDSQLLKIANTIPVPFNDTTTVPVNKIINNIIVKLTSEKFLAFLNHYNDYCDAVYLGDYEKALALSAHLLVESEQCENAIWDINIFRENILNIRAATLINKGKRNDGLAELAKVHSSRAQKTEDKIRYYILNDPGRYLKLNEINFIGQSSLFYLDGMRNGKWSSDNYQK